MKLFIFLKVLSMQVFKDEVLNLPQLTKLQENSHSCIATIGNFDGVHLAHASLIKTCVKHAKKENLPSVLITFDPHPSKIFSKKPILPLLSLEERLSYIEKLGIDICYVLPFNKDFASQQASVFIENLLYKKLHCKELIVGYNFIMGSDNLGGEDLKNALHKFSCDLHIHKEFFIEFENKQQKISSSVIRKTLKVGNIPLVNAMLGREHSVIGTVIHGAKRGSALLGFPTANMDTGDLLLPKAGVYATSVSFNKSFISEHKSISNIGYNPTFGSEKLIMETCILNFSRDFYGEDLRVFFHSYMRAEKKFNNINDLIKQLTQDKEYREKNLETHPRLYP